MKKYKPYILLIFVMSIVFGWMHADRNVTVGEAKEDVWANAINGLQQSRNYEALKTRLKASGLFPISEVRSKLLNLNVEDKNAGEQSEPNFPRIVGSSIVNGTGKVLLRLDDERIVSGKEGDELENGWQIKAVDLDRVIAVYDGKEQEFLVTNYKKQKGVGGDYETEDENKARDE